MPRIPTFERRLGPQLVPTPSAAAAGMPARQAAQAFDQATQMAFAEREREIKRTQRMSLYENEAKVNAVLNEAAAKFGERQDFKAFPGEHDAFVRERLDGLIDGIDDMDVSDEINSYATRRSAAQSRAMTLRASGLSRDATVATVGVALEGDAASFGMATTDEDRALIIRDAKRRTMFATEAGDLSEADRLKLDSKFESDAAMAKARHLINTDPYQALEELRGGDEILDTLDGEKREVLVASAEVAIRQLENAAKQGKTAADQALYGDFIEGIYGEGRMPTMADVAQSELSPPVKEKLFKLIRDDADGINLNRTDYALTMDYYERILDQTRPDAIHDIAEVTHLGEGVSIADYKSMKTQLATNAKDPAAAANGKVWTKFLANAKAQIAETTAFATDKVGENNYWLYYRMALDEKARLEKEGVPFMEMMNPHSKHYLGNLMGPFLRTFSEELNDNIGSLSADEAALPTSPVVQGEAGALPEVKAPKRLEGESGTDYVKRMLSGAAAFQGEQ
jgi:hypothetical protein